MKTQVAIIGAGPAGLMLGHLLHLYGIDSVILENRSQGYVIDRVRAGVLEQHVVDLMCQTGIGDRLRGEGLRHEGIHIAFGGTRRHINFVEHTGKAIWVYGQNEVVRDLIRARQATGRHLHFEVEDLTIHGLDSDQPSVHYRHNGEPQTLRADYIAGCDGFHGTSRPTIPAGILRNFDRVYPFAWLGILAHAAPSSEELVYSLHERGFALFSMRTPEITRLYLQCATDDDIANWPDTRIWSELQTRLCTTDGWKPNEGEIFQKSITPMRSLVVEPMQYNRLFLAGDAAHIVPPTGAKGLNLAVADVRVLAHALSLRYVGKGDTALQSYSDTCLARIWKAQRFSWWMTSMLHRQSSEIDFDFRRQMAELDYLTSSKAAMTSLAENYAGLDLNIPLPA